jgi:hypothetical protein
MLARKGADHEKDQVEWWLFDEELECVTKELLDILVFADSS